ncbi:MAG: serine/threonine-protein kinase [Pirellulales bacterium]
MLTTTFFGDHHTQTLGAEQSPKTPEQLLQRYQDLIQAERLQWTTYHRLERLLGSGGQGVVFLSHRRGADGFTLPVAMKFFSPERFPKQAGYEHAMGRIGRVAAKVAQMQHDNVLNVQDFIDRNRVRIMVMEWIDGYDLRHLLSLQRLSAIQSRVTPRRWDYINSVIVTAGPDQARFKAGVAVAIVRDCLAALAALHRERIVHGDIKPSNIMLKRTGLSKVIDIGSAFEIDDAPNARNCTPAYAAPEVLENRISTPRSDLASLGYVLVEMLSGRPCFSETQSLRELLEAKRSLPHRLHQVLPPEVTCNDLLMNFCRGLIAPDPGMRFPSAEAAELLEDGAASFHRQLVLSDLSSEYSNDIRVWLEELRHLDQPSRPT